MRTPSCMRDTHKIEYHVKTAYHVQLGRTFKLLLKGFGVMPIFAPADCLQRRLQHPFNLKLSLEAAHPPGRGGEGGGGPRGVGYYWVPFGAWRRKYNGAHSAYSKYEKHA
jgi:hypothetical protein